MWVELNQHSPGTLILMWVTLKSKSISDCTHVREMCCPGSYTKLSKLKVYARKADATPRGRGALVGAWRGEGWAAWSRWTTRGDPYQDCRRSAP